MTTAGPRAPDNRVERREGHSAPTLGPAYLTREGP